MENSFSNLKRDRNHIKDNELSKLGVERKSREVVPQGDNIPMASSTPRKSLKRKSEKPITDLVVSSKSSEGDLDMEPEVEYAKKSRLDYNFWNELTNPTEIEECKGLQIKDLQIGNYYGKPLKVRITFKSHVRPMSKGGHIFNVHGMDGSSEIGMVCFDKAGFRFNDQLRVNMVYYLENFIVRKESESYPSGTGNVFQIKLKEQSKFEQADDVNFPEMVFNFVRLDEINSLSYNDRVDVIGILVKDNGLEPNYRHSPKRDLAITDESKETVFVSLWGAEASYFEADIFSVIIIKRGYILEVEGKIKINSLYGTLIWCKPQTPEAVKLDKWFKSEQLKIKKF